MPRSDYSHHGEEADIVWWLEEGRHEPYEPDPYPDDELLDDDPDVEAWRSPGNPVSGRFY